MNRTLFVASIAIAFAIAGTALVPPVAVAHCDGLDGPVVQAARLALESRDPDPALVWVREDDEPEILRAFNRAIEVRALGGEARALADRYFFETLVRVHRAGEGAVYTGLKPAGRDLGPAIPLADEALASGKLEPLEELITGALEGGLAERFRHAITTKGRATEDVAAGREFVEAYVTFVHYVERAYAAASQPVEGHFPDDHHALEGHDG
jgi:hypothetical protein